MKRRWMAALLFILALAPSARLAWIGRDMPQLGSIWDDGVYWVSAKSLADGSGYRILHLPGQPHQTKYPPLYPLLLSVVWKINPHFPGNLRLAVFVSWVMFPVFLLVVLRTYRLLGLGRAHSWGLVAFLALNPAILMFSVSLMTELMFASLLLLSLSVAERAGTAGSPAWRGLAAGTIGGAAFLTRSAAGPLLIISPIVCLLKRRRRQAVLFFLAMLPAVAGWILWSHSHQSAGGDAVTLYYTNYAGYQAYNVSAGNLPQVLYRNTAGLLAGTGGLFLANVEGAAFVRALSLALAVLAIAGMIRLTWRARATQHMLFGCAFLLVLLLWHFPPDERYVMPLFPLLLAGLTAEVGRLAQAVRKAFLSPQIAQRAAAAAMCLSLASLGALAVYLNISALVRHIPRTFERERSQLTDLRKAHRWISENLSPDCAFLAHYDSVLYLHTGCHATRLVVPPRLYYARDVEGLIRYISHLGDFAREAGLSYVMLGPGDFYSPDLPDNGAPFVRRLVSNSRDFQPLYETPNVSIYRIRAARAATP